MNGHLQVVCGPSVRGTSRLEALSFASLAHVSKPHHDENMLVLQFINPTAGLFEGDTLDIRITVREGAQLCVSTPSSNRIHPAIGDGFAQCHQTLLVESHAFLEFIPEVFIPFAGCRYRQHTHIECAPSAQALFFDWWSPGRVAMGEAFAFDRLEMSFDAFIGDTLLLREKSKLATGTKSIVPWQSFSPSANVITVYGCGGDPEAFSEEIDALQSDAVYIGHGPLPNGAWIVRALCRDNLSARVCLQRLRPVLHRAFGKTPPRLGRI